MKIRSSRKAAIIGVILGLFFGLVGTVLGLYMGVIKPALDAGATMHISVQAGVTLALIFFFMAAIAIVALRRQKSAGSLDDRWK